MGVLPIVPSAALQLGIDKGIFKEHGFDVSLETGQGGAALLPAVVSGQMQFAISNPLSLMLAQDEGLDVRMVTGYSHALKEGDDITSVWTKPDSGIESPADLSGKTVAVNNLKTQGEVSIREVVQEGRRRPGQRQLRRARLPRHARRARRRQHRRRLGPRAVPDRVQGRGRQAGHVQLPGDHAGRADHVHLHLRQADRAATRSWSTTSPRPSTTSRPTPRSTRTRSGRP